MQNINDLFGCSAGRIFRRMLVLAILLKHCIYFQVEANMLCSVEKMNLRWCAPRNKLKYYLCNA